MVRMTVERLLKVHQAKPFRPYRLRLTDGTEILIPRPECIAFHPMRPRTLGVSLPDGVIKIINLSLVASIQVVRSGARRRRTEKAEGLT